MVPNPVRPKLEIACPPQCSFRPDVIGTGPAAALLVIREGGAGANVFGRHAAEILGRPVPSSSVERHLRHYREVDPSPPPDADSGEKVTDLEILDRIISSGARNAKNWKPTIGDTLKAMEMKLRLTGNSAFENMLDAMAAASVDEEVPGVPEAPEAVAAEEERTEEPPVEPAA